MLFSSFSLANEVTLETVNAAGIGATIKISVTGEIEPRSFLTIVPRDSAEGKYSGYVYVNQSGAYEIVAPAEPGEYEVRLLGPASPYPTIASQVLKLSSASANIEAPETVKMGSTFSATWSGPNNPRDYITLAKADSDARSYISYEYTSKGSPVTITAPDQPGRYELRYVLASGNKILAVRQFSVSSVSASISVPDKVSAGAVLQITWQGPDNPRDFIIIVPEGEKDKTYNGAYVYTSKGNPVALTAPDKPGRYEVRYLSNQTYATLASALVVVEATTANLKASATAVAGSNISVSWTGPDNSRDYITIVPRGAAEGTWKNYTYTAKGNPLNLLAPQDAGEYEIRYATGQSYTTLATLPITITPATLKMGQLSVALDEKNADATNAVEVILDASGSMLQKLEGTRRIDIAKQTLTHLTTKAIPPKTLFALRVFGREENSCQSDLEMPLAPLNPNEASKKINAIAAKNNAKTPIGASLEKITEDLSSSKGKKLVILLTDGEETCNGDPLATIEALRKSGVDVHINIVGFAISDTKLQATFAHWATAGAGQYYNANSGSELGTALVNALKQTYEVLDPKGQLVTTGLTGGAPVELLPGQYTVQLRGQEKRKKSVQVEEEKTAQISL